MKEALKEAALAFEKKEVPIGAVLVRDGEIIARAHNEVESRKDASAHAELLCLQKAAAQTGNWRLTNTILYSTLEPCPMCAGALILFRVKKLSGVPKIFATEPMAASSIFSRATIRSTLWKPREVCAKKKRQLS